MSRQKQWTTEDERLAMQRAYNKKWYHENKNQTKPTLTAILAHVQSMNKKMDHLISVYLPAIEEITRKVDLIEWMIMKDSYPKVKIVTMEDMPGNRVKPEEFI